MSAPVRVLRPSGFASARLAPAGDTEVTDLITDRLAARRLEGRTEFGGGALGEATEVAVPPPLLARLPRLREFAVAAAAEAGFATTELVRATEAPDRMLRQNGVRIVVGAAVYAIHETGGTSRGGSLRAWADGPLDRRTSLHAIYADDPTGEPADGGDGGGDPRVESPFHLTPAQRRAVVRARYDALSVISGAPGTGKSHTIAAIACDALARGERVLVAAKSDATVDALLDLLERAPGPDPVVFGSNERRDALAARLAGGQRAVADVSSVAAARQRATRAAEDRDRVQAEVVALLEAEAACTAADPAEDRSRALAPALFDPATDLEAVRTLVERAAVPRRGRMTTWRRRRRHRELRARAGAADDASIADLEMAIASATRARAGHELAARGGLDLTAEWSQLVGLEAAARDALGQWLAADSRSSERLNRSTLPVVAAVATGLRSGRAARREQLRRLDDQRLTRALPLWIGSLPDIDDLLPPIPALFDLVILDEASSIDQPTAAPALLRGRRAVVVGDPRQLRHVSFLSDGQLARTAAAHRLEDPVAVARLDVRRNSIFDVAAGRAPVHVLDEHFRSDPHLVSFVFDRLYGGDVTVATRSATTDSRDCVEVLRIAGARNRAGAVEAEVRRVVREVRRLRRDGHRSVGVVTPFRAQADAIEAALLSEFTADDLIALDLRVGTVHAFQGNERDLIIVSMGVGDDASSRPWRFVEDPHLFCVLATRARRQLVVIVSGEPPADGLLHDYLAQADLPPGPPSGIAPLPEWPAAVADDLEAAGADIRRSYPTGRHVVDVCVAGRGLSSVAVDCRVHPEGGSAHVERHLALRRAGWTIEEAYASRWGHRRGELTVELLRALGLRGSAA